MEFMKDGRLIRIVDVKKQERMFNSRRQNVARLGLFFSHSELPKDTAWCLT